MGLRGSQRVLVSFGGSRWLSVFGDASKHISTGSGGFLWVIRFRLNVAGLGGSSWV